MNDGRYEQTQVEDRWETVLPDGTVRSRTDRGLDYAIAHERKQREAFTVIYAELVLNGVDDDALQPPAPAREVVHTRTTTTTMTVVETLDRHVIDHSRAQA